MDINKHIQSLEGPILVLGASGFIGANLFKMLLSKREDVYGVCRLERGWRLEGVDTKNIMFTDVNDSVALKNLINTITPRTVFDFISYGGYSFEESHEIVYQTNFLSLTNIVTLLEEKGVSAYIHAGTSSEYGLNSKQPKEDSILEPNSHYSSSKIAASYFLKYVGKTRNFPSINLRLYSVYGPLEDSSRLIPNILNNAKLKKFPPLVDPDISRDFIFIDDACEAFILAASKIHPDLYGESFNIGTGNKTTIKDLALTIKKIYKIKENPIFSNMSKRSWDVTEWYSDSKKAENIFGWKSKTSLIDGLNLTFKWLSTLTNNDFISITKQNSSNKKRSISAIIACYKDEKAIPIMYQRLTKTFKEIKIDYEIIFVCDGSPHNDIDVIKEISKKDSRVIGVNHSRNFGSQMAFRSGMELSTKQAVVLLDGDLQDPPELIKDFVRKWLEGNDVVYGTRVKREMPFLWGLLYKSFYRILSSLSFIKIPLDAGDFSLLDKRVVSWILKCPERDLFMRGIRAFVGFKQVGVDYIRPERMFGSSTNSLIKNIGWAKMGILSFTNTPLNMMTIMGFVTLLISIFLILLFASLKIFFPDIAPKGATTIMLLILSFGSINLFAISLVGEYIGKIILEVKQRPRVIRSEIIRSGFTTEL
jgi:nucleoside-diphosphate-sugar epimerase/glycosyltransferase involved in cell wall biosynthesis